MNSKLNKIFGIHNMVCLLGFLFCIVWGGRSDSFTLTVFNSVICLFVIVITAKIKTKYYKLMTPGFLLISFLLCFFACVFEGTEQPAVVAGYLMHATDFVALAYAFTVPQLASAFENMASRKEKVYEYSAYILCPLFMMLARLNMGMVCIIIFGAFTGVLVSGYIKNKLLTGIAFIVIFLFSLSFFLVPILGIDKLTKQDEVNVMQIDRNDKTDKMFRRVHIWSNKIYSIWNADKEAEPISAQELSVTPTKAHHTTIFVTLRDKMGNWAYCIPLLLLSCVARTTIRALKYSDIVYQKILGNIMASTLFVMILADLMIPYTGDDITGFSLVVMAVMIGVTASCIKSAKGENEKYYSITV